MRRVAIGVGPRFFPRQHFALIRESLASDQMFQRRQPMLVVARAVVRFAPIGGGLEFLGQRSRPLFPGEMALRGKPYCQRKGLGLPGLREDRTALIARQRGQRRQSLGSAAKSGMLEIAIPQVNVNGIARRGIVAPQFARRKTNRI